MSFEVTPRFIDKVYYGSRVVSYYMALAMLFTHYNQKGYAYNPLFLLLVIDCATFPHIAFFSGYWIGFDKRYWLNFKDMAFVGFLANATATFSLPVLLYATLTTSNLIVVAGIRWAGYGALAATALFIVSGFLGGFSWYDSFSQEVNIMSGVLLFIYPVFLAYIEDVRAKTMKKSRALLKEKKQAMEEQKNELLALNEELQQMNEELQTNIQTIEAQKREIEHQYQDITQSIDYAKRIQDVILPSPEQISHFLDDYFIFFKPRDVVSGDFYACFRTEGKTFFAAVDATGHGVPGAFMSIIGYNLLHEIIMNRHYTEADVILNKMHKGIRNVLKQESSQSRDGIDLALIVIEPQKQSIDFAGAKNPLIYIQNEQIFHIKGDKFCIGGEQKETQRLFQKHTIQLLPDSPTMFYLFSDGYQDQFGGDGTRTKKFMLSRMKQLFLDIHQKPTKEQADILAFELETWMRQGHEKQLDDILVTGIRVTFK